MIWLLFASACFAFVIAIMFPVGFFGPPKVVYMGTGEYEVLKSKLAQVEKERDQLKIELATWVAGEQ